MLENLERELQKWREMRAAKPQLAEANPRRSLKVNGQAVTVVRRKPRTRAD